MGNNLLLYGVLAVGGYIWYTRFNGRETINNLLGPIKGQFNSGQNVSGNLDDLINQAKSGSGSWTDDKGNNFNNQSGKNMQINRQSNVGTGGNITQTQKHEQHSSVLYTGIKFGNL